MLVENFRPGTMERIGYGWDAVHARWPRLVYAAASGFGHTGPLAPRPAFDLVVQAMGGIMSMTGHPGGPPARVGVSIGDMVAGLYLAIGIQAALTRRRDTGTATKVDVAMFDCQLALLENALTTHLATGHVPGPLGTRHPNIAPFQAFAGADGRRFVVCAGHDNLFRRFSDAIGRPDLPDDSRFLTADDRRTNADLLGAEIESVLTTRPAAHWLDVLELAGIPVAPINTVADAVRHPQAKARDMIVEVDDPNIGTLYVAGNPVKLADVPEQPTRRPPPPLDGDRQAILDWLKPR